MNFAARRHDWDYSDYARLPDDGSRYEVLDGVLLETPRESPNHQYVLTNAAMAVDAHVRRHHLGLMFPGVDLLCYPGQFLRPDFLVVPPSSRAGVTNRGIEMAPSLVVEIASPASREIDLVKKPLRYSDLGIPEYWVLDPDERCAWVWRFAEGRTAPERVTGTLTWQPEGAPESLLIDLDDVLQPIWGARR